MKKIRGKIWLGMMFLTAVVLVFLWLFQVVFLDQFYRFVEIEQVKKQGREIAERISSSNDPSQILNEEELLGEIEKFTYQKQISVEIISTDYEIIYQSSSDSTSMLPGMMNESLLKVIETSVKGEENQLEAQHPRFGYRYELIGLPIVHNESTIGVLLIIKPLASIDEAVHVLTIQMVLITALLLLVSMLLAFIISKILTAPILRIISQAESFSKGNYDVRIWDIKKDEIGNLAVRMNQMGEALSKNEKLQKELIANVSHELRTPLTLIRGYAETIRDVSGENPEKRNRQLGVIIEETQMLGSIVDDILNLSRLQSGSVELELKEVHLNELITKIREHFMSGQYKREIQLVGFDQNDLFIYADQNKLQQVIYNLVGNALSHSLPESPVTIAAISDENKIRIEVKNLGEGIEESEIPYLFDRYYRGAHMTDLQGTGLGLAIVKSILELHHYEYGVTSTMGEETIFWFEVTKEKHHKSF